MYKDIFESIRNEAEKRNLERTIQLYCSDVCYFLRWMEKMYLILHLKMQRVFLLPNVWKEGLLKLTITIGLQSSSYIRRCLKILWDDDTVPGYEKRAKSSCRTFRDEINAIIDATPNLKHKAIIATMYSSGLRVSEVVHLHYDDISRTNMTIHVRETKGRIDRYTILSQKILTFSQSIGTNVVSPKIPFPKFLYRWIS